MTDTGIETPKTEIPNEEFQAVEGFALECCDGGQIPLRGDAYLLGTRTELPPGSCNCGKWDGKGDVSNSRDLPKRIPLSSMNLDDSARPSDQYAAEYAMNEELNQVFPEVSINIEVSISDGMRYESSFNVPLPKPLKSSHTDDLVNHEKVKKLFNMACEKVRSEMALQHECLFTMREVDVRTAETGGLHKTYNDIIQRHVAERPPRKPRVLRKRQTEDEDHADRIDTIGLP